MLPPVDDFLAAITDALRWLLTATHPVEALPTIPAKAGHELVPAVAFSAPALGLGRSIQRGARVAPTEAYGSNMDRIRYSARNRLLTRVDYHGVSRLVEPYSLRLPGTGNLLLYVYEVQRGAGAGGGIRHSRSLSWVMCS